MKSLLRSVQDPLRSVQTDFAQIKDHLSQPVSSTLCTWNSEVKWSKMTVWKTLLKSLLITPSYLIDTGLTQPMKQCHLTSC